MTGRKIKWTDELVNDVWECHAHYNAWIHARNTLDLMWAEDLIPDPADDAAIIAAAKLRAMQ